MWSAGAPLRLRTCPSVDCSACAEADVRSDISRSLSAMMLVCRWLRPQQPVCGRSDLIAPVADTRQEAGFAELLDLAAIDARAAKIVGRYRSERPNQGHRAILIRRLAGS